jgi:hypothetical protein
MRNLFEVIADLINGKPAQNGTPAVASAESEILAGPTNAIAKKDDLCRGVIRLLKSNYSGGNPNFEDKVLTLWINDSLFYDSVSGDDFKEDLTSRVYDELGFDLSDIEIKNGAPSDGASSTQVMNNVYLQIQSVQVDNVGEAEPGIVRKAIITDVEDGGSTIEGKYELDSQKIKELPGKRYNIGVGKTPRMDNGIRRFNDIAIDGDEKSPQFDKNKYVSRAHAYITYSENRGFMLHVEHGGTKEAGKRTSVNRAGNEIKLENVLIPQPLKHGDIIVLSKNVELLFEEVK